MTDDELQTILQEARQLRTLLTRTSERFDRAAALMAASADRQVAIVDRLEKQILSNDRTNESNLWVRQKLTELYDQREYIRAGIDQLRADLATHFAVMKNDLDDVDRGLDRIRDQSGKFLTLSPEAIEKEAADRAEALRIKAEAEAKAIETTAAAEAEAIKRDPWLSRVFVVVFKGSTGAQVTAVVLALIAAVALILGGAQTLKSLFPSWFAPAPAPAAAKAAEKGAAPNADDEAKP